MKLVLAISLLISLQTITVQAQNWPGFSGASASGVADGAHPSTTWNADRAQNVVWKTPIPGLSHASPIVWANKIFVVTAISNAPKSSFNPKDRGIDLANDDVKHTWRIYCLDRKTGRIIWDKTAFEGVPRAKRHVKATQANSTPVTDGKYVVALFGAEGLNCYDANPMGKVLMATPALSDGLLILRTDNHIYAIGEVATQASSRP